MRAIETERSHLGGVGEMDVYGKSDIGAVRSINQDDMKFKKMDDNTLWSVVCDGMGGAKGGEIASSIATSEISKMFDDALKENTLSGKNLKSIMELSVIKAGEEIYNTSLKDGNLTGMGTTVVASLIYNNVLHVVHIGDSRVYIVNKSGINQITTDHSVVQEMVNNGEITKEEASIHPNKNIITRALGIKQKSLPDYNKYNLDDGDAVLMCTDGLTNELSDEEIYKIFISSAPQDIPDRLINEANNRRGSDNITVAVII